MDIQRLQINRTDCHTQLCQEAIMNFKYFNCSRLMTVVLGEGLEEIFGAGIFAIVCSLENGRE